MTASIRLSTGAPGSRILGVGAHRPTRVVPNDELAAAIDSSDQWIRERSGIISRHFADDNENVATMAHSAAAKALAAAGIQPEQIDLVIVATLTHDRPTPSASALVADKLGAPHAAAFDVGAACAGFCHALALADQAIRGGTAHYAVVVGAEKLSTYLNMSDRGSAFIFGDGAGAVVVGPSDTVVWGGDTAPHEAIATSTTWSQGRGGAACPTITMQGQAVFRWAVFSMVPVALRVLEAAGVTLDDLSAFVPHQANDRIIDAMIRQLKLPAHIVVSHDIAHDGNTSAASIPLALANLADSGAVRSGGLALLLGFGAGLVYAGQVVALP